MAEATTHTESRSVTKGIQLYGGSIVVAEASHGRCHLRQWRDGQRASGGGTWIGIKQTSKQTVKQSKQRAARTKSASQVANSATLKSASEPARLLFRIATLRKSPFHTASS